MDPAAVVPLEDALVEVFELVSVAVEVVAGVDVVAGAAVLGVELEGLELPHHAATSTSARAAASPRPRVDMSSVIRDGLINLRFTAVPLC